MASGILARVISKRLRKWTEENGILDNNQVGFRPERSTAGATQIILIQEDMKDLNKRQGRICEDTTAPEASAKAYPRVSKHTKTSTKHNIP